MANSTSSSSSSSVQYSSSSSFLYSSSSSSSIDSSSSSSFLYSSSSSSSSSSLHDYSYERLIPFTVESYRNDPAWDVAYYGDYIFVGTGSNGEILRSSNRYHWGVYYKTNDVHVSAVHVRGSCLYAGTSPNGNVFRFNLTNNGITRYGSFGNAVVGFVTFNGDLFLAFENGSIYKYSERLDQWDSIYRTYSNIFDMDIVDDKICLAMQGANLICFDGSEWQVIEMNNKNIASIRKVKGETSFVDNMPMDRNITTGERSSAEMFEIFPQNRSMGISCIEQDGTSMIMGSSSHGRIYSLLDGELKTIFDIDSNIVHDLLNIDVGVNLASIGNKLFLIHCGEVEKDSDGGEDTNGSQDDSEEENPNEGKSVVMTYPNGGENLELGEDIVIQWSSTRNYNDAVRLALYKGGSEVQTIASQTTNDGRFEWTIPLSLEVGEDYKIEVEWLSAGETESTDKDLSDNDFSVGLVSPTTTTTTTTSEPDSNAPDLSACRGIPILVLPESEYITMMSKDNTLNAVVLLTSTGRVIEAKETVINGYLTGERDVRADVRSGMGFSNSSSTQFTYALYNKVVEINEEKEVEKWKYVEKPSAIPVEKISGIFIGPALYVQEDIGAWKTLIWTEEKNDNTEITIAIKCANSLSELNDKEWEHTYASQNEGDVVAKDLKSSELSGRYAQIKVDMDCEGPVSPSTTDVSLVYTTKQASYFFTTTFSLENGSDVNKGMIVAEITEPVNTEVEIGMADTNSNDWNDYETIPMEKLFDIEKYENLKIGMKLTSYDDTHVPEVSNFAIISGGDKKGQIK